MKIHQLLLLICIMSCLTSLAQRNVYTREGKPILNRSSIITNCLKSLHKDRSDKTALAICECQVSKLDRRFTAKQYEKHIDGVVINLEALIKEDSAVQKAMQDCYLSSGKTVLLQAEGFEQEFISACENSVRKSSEKELDAGKVHSFCLCQLQMVKNKKLTDEELLALSDPNSVQYYEMIYTCGNPYLKESEAISPAKAQANIAGPITDTVAVLTLNGMTYVKMKIGSLVKVWLLDTGASDLLVSTEIEEALKKEKIIGDNNYLGVAEYELANGTIDTCRRYRVNSVQIGGFTIDNVVLAVTEKGKRIIAGKAILNQFKTWSLNNNDNKLILSRQ